MSEHVFFITLGLLFGTILVVFGMKYMSSAFQAWARVTGEGAYKALAEKTGAAQADAAASLTAIKSELTDIKLRLTAVEKILKAVE